MIRFVSVALSVSALAFPAASQHSKACAQVLAIGVNSSSFNSSYSYSENFTRWLREQSQRNSSTQVGFDFPGIIGFSGGTASQWMHAIDTGEIGAIDEQLAISSFSKIADPSVVRAWLECVKATLPNQKLGLSFRSFTLGEYVIVESAYNTTIRGIYELPIGSVLATDMSPVHKPLQANQLISPFKQFHVYRVTGPNPSLVIDSVVGATAIQPSVKQGRRISVYMFSTVMERNGARSIDRSGWREAGIKTTPQASTWLASLPSELVYFNPNNAENAIGHQDPFNASAPSINRKSVPGRLVATYPLNDPRIQSGFYLLMDTWVRDIGQTTPRDIDKYSWFVKLGDVERVGVRLFRTFARKTSDTWSSVHWVVVTE